MGFFDKFKQPRQVKDFYFMKQAIEDGLSGNLKAMAIRLWDPVAQEINQTDGVNPGRQNFLNSCRDVGVWFLVMTMYMAKVKDFLDANPDSASDKQIAGQLYILIAMIQLASGAPDWGIKNELTIFAEKHGVDPANCGLSADEIENIAVPIAMKPKHLRGKIG